MGIYEQTAQLWRPEAEMKAGFMNATSIATALLFVMIFCQLVKDKTRNKGIKLGLLVGLLVGTFSGLGSYAYMPIPLNLAIGWFAAQTVKFTVAGFITGSVVKSDIK